jgi:hypothetical protein
VGGRGPQRGDPPSARRRAGLRDAGLAGPARGGVRPRPVGLPAARRASTSRATSPASAGCSSTRNAVSPATVEAIRAIVEARRAPVRRRRHRRARRPSAQARRVFLSGPDAALGRRRVRRAPASRTPVLGPDPGRASALKMAYAAWTKGTAALLLAIRATARAEGVEDALLAEWARSQPDATAPARGRRRTAAARKGWRWVAEMEEIAATFAAAGQPTASTARRPRSYRSQ